MEKIIARIGHSFVPLNRQIMEEAKKRQSNLAKPPGSLGRLEELSVQIAGITGNVCSRIEKRCIIILSADNGVRDEGVASAPQWVTTAQTMNFIRRTTGVGVLAKHTDTDLLVVDVGVDYDFPDQWLSKDPALMKDRIIDRKIARGTRNLHVEPAMDRRQAEEAVLIGVEMVEYAKKMGYDILGVGEMGIGNTTTSAAVLAALVGCNVKDAVGRGGGITDAAYAKKINVVKKATAREFKDPLDIVAKVGGFDICAMVGVFLGAAFYRLPIVIDGYISAVGALLAEKMFPGAAEFMIASHKSREAGYAIAIENLGKEPLFDVGMRLGEGSGCPIAFQIIGDALAIMNDMATFAEAEINDNYLEEIRKGGHF